MVDAYTQLLRLEQEGAAAGISIKPVTEALNRLGAFALCVTCNHIISECTKTTAHMLACGHVVHKTGRCYENGNRCVICRR